MALFRAFAVATAATAGEWGTKESIWSKRKASGAAR